MAEPINPSPYSPVDFPPSLSRFAIPPITYLTANPSLSGLIVSAVVVHHSRALLVQRAATDGFPLLWECPGGSVDADADTTILHAVQRELREETGLVLTRVTALLDESVEWDTREGRWRKITFLVEVEGGKEDGKMPEVVLNAEEHADFVWAGREEVRECVCDGRRVEFAYIETEGLVLEALDMVKGTDTYLI